MSVAVFAPVCTYLSSDTDEVRSNAPMSTCAVLHLVLQRPTELSLLSALRVMIIFGLWPVTRQSEPNFLLFSEFSIFYNTFRPNLAIFRKYTRLTKLQGGGKSAAQYPFIFSIMCKTRCRLFLCHCTALLSCQVFRNCRVLPADGQVCRNVVKNTKFWKQ